MRLLSVIRKHGGVTALGAAVLLAGGGAATAMAVSPASDSGEVFEQPATEPAETTAPTATTTAPTPQGEAATPEPEPSVTPAEPTEAATVDDMAKPTTAAPRPSASEQAAMSVPPGVTPIDPADPARGGHNADGAYIPAVPVPKAGEPPADAVPPGPPAGGVPQSPADDDQ